jgi:hypothetical protein
MSGQWQPDAGSSSEIGCISAPARNFKRELTTKQVRAAHNRTADKRFPTVNQYLDEFTKELNIELQKQE